jgi:hypothetical protein
VNDGRRYELPEGLTPEEERAAIAALERYFSGAGQEPNPWALAGRLEATGLGILQTRRFAKGAWGRAARGPFARRGAPTHLGRGDSR